MLNRFREKSYPESCLHTAVETTNRLERKDLFTKRTKSKKPFSVNYVLTFNAISSTIKDTVSKYWHILSSDKTLNNVFQHPPLFTFKRATSLRDRLVKADMHINKPKPIILGNFPCRSCTSCANMKRTDIFHNSHTDKEYRIKSLITCNTSHVIYLLFCPCNKQYIGQTSRKLKIRLNEHRSSIKRADITSPVARHFSDLGHKVDDLKCIGIEKVWLNRRGGNHERLLLQRECYWIHTLKTLFPMGMNEECNMSPFL